MQVWRICKKRYSDAAFTGEGARLYSGRWNPAGVRMVYTSSSLALAALEFFVHLDPSVAPDDLVSVSATIPSALKVERFAQKDLPTDWRAAENPELQTIGAAWASSKRSVAFEVPSVVIEGEWNVLLNPAHPQFPKVQIAEPKPFYFDKRMFRTR
jgi:RES domain-containing protein